MSKIVEAVGRATVSGGIFIPSKNNRRKAQRLAPWAEVITKVDGGFYAFKHRADYEMWVNKTLEPKP